MHTYFMCRCLRNLERLLATTGARLVLSNHWRNHPEQREFIERGLAEYCVEVYDHTPQLGDAEAAQRGHDSARGHEIHSWLQMHTVLSYVILEGGRSGLRAICDVLPDANIISCVIDDPLHCASEGLSEAAAAEAVRLLSPQKSEQPHPTL